jgi:hypothetical protein
VHGRTFADDKSRARDTPIQAFLPRDRNDGRVDILGTARVTRATQSCRPTRRDADRHRFPAPFVPLQTAHA